MIEPLLIHACCGPCSLEPIRLLREEGFEPTIVWSNSNIQPVSEHDLRFETLKAWAAAEHIDVIETPYLPEEWEHRCAPFAFEHTKRCRACYAMRLEQACSVAKEQGFSYISTTLAVSPWQLFEICNEVLVKLAQAYGLQAVVRDFRPYYPEAVQRSRALGMYRQKYCGCRFSAAEAQIQRIEARNARRREHGKERTYANR